MRSRKTRNLGRAEQAVMDYVWGRGPASAEDCRKGLRDTWPMKESTVRTVLLRLEQKGFLTHTVEGRAFIYHATENRTGVAARAVRQIIQRFCGGSAEELVLGMVAHDVLSAGDLARLSKKIAAAKKSRAS
jgi:BlaI family transcriptional regulator, penicillinase repressor